MTTQPIPYPADTKAKGWRFEIDMEKVESSDTWLRAKTGEVRGALLLLWAKSWQQVPCGSLPNDDELVSLLIDMPDAKFAKHRAVLMRGWWVATDGRLYHDTITARVYVMLEKRASDAARAANRRAKLLDSHADSSQLTQESRATNAGLQGEFDTKHQAPSTSNTSSLRSEVKPARAPRKPSADAAPTLTLADLTSEGVKEQHARDWLKVRDKKRAPLTQTAWDLHKSECVKAGITPGQGVQVCAAASWQGLDHTWNWRKFLPAAEVATTPTQSKFGGCDAVEPA